MGTQQRVFDYEAKDKATLEAARKTVTDLFPVTSATRTLRVKRLWVGDAPDPTDFSAMKEAFYQGKTWGTPLHASLELVDNASGKVIDSVNKLKVMDVPRLTPLYGYLVDGKYRYLQNQIRLQSGAYSTVGADGTFQTQLMTAQGHNHKVFLDPKTSLVTMTPSGSSSEVKLLPVLRDLGMSSDAIKKVWGDKVYQANLTAAGKAMDTEVVKFHHTLFSKNRGYKKPDRERAIAELHDYFTNKTSISPETTKRLLGKSFTKVGPDLLLASSQRLLSMSRGETEPDDRNSMANRGLFSVDTFLREKLEDSKDKIHTSVLRQIDKRDKIREIISSAPFNRPIKGFFNASEMASPIKQTNPMQMIGETFKTTVMGEGGIGSIRSITEEMRLLHGSHAGILDPVHTPEGEHIGITLAVAMGAQAMPDNSLGQEVISVRTGKPVLVSARDLADKTVAFPGEFRLTDGGAWVPTKRRVRTLKGFKDTISRPHQVDYIMSDANSMFSPSSNVIPFMGSVSGPRAMTGSKQVEQALPLTNPEAPLVQCGIGRGSSKSFERAIGGHWTATAEVPGIVTKVTQTGVTVRGRSGEKTYGLFDHFPLNELSYLHSRPRVKVGDRVDVGHTLADNTFTDGGTLALGKNLLVATMSHPSGRSFEDGIVLSEDAAKKMTSPHLHRITVKGGENVSLSHEQFTNRFPGIYSPDQLSRLDPKGLPRPGQVLRKGDPMALRLVQEALAPEDKILQQLRRGFIQPLKNRTVHWEEDFDGEVVEVHKQGGDYTVVVKTEEPTRVGDKLANRYGGKGIVSAVLPTAQMPHTKDGRAIDLMFNSQGIMKRMNPAVVHEQLAAKVAASMGNKVIHVHNFDAGSSHRKVMELAKKYGVSDKEDLIDPATGRTISQIAVGPVYYSKLDHPVKKKFSVHSLGPYDAEGIPLRGHDYGGQSLDLLTIYALLAHGAKSFLKESSLKGNVNHEWWRAYRTGQIPPLPRDRQVFTRFTELLKGAGIQVTQKGSQHMLSPLLDRHVEKISNGLIQKPRQVWAKNLAPEKYGLFDPHITGGLQGQKWGHIDLAEPVPHPTFEDPIRILTGLTQKQLDDLVERKIVLDQDSLEPKPSGAGLTGGAAIREKLKRINMPERIKTLQGTLNKLKGPALDKANRELRYLQALELTGIRPEEYVVSKIPVLPPTMRPVYPDENGDLRHSDLNFLYRDLMLINEGLKGLEGVPEAEKTRQRQDLMDAFRALTGVSSKPALIAGEDRKGILHNISGIPQPKMGYWQSKLLSRRQDMAGRSTIIGAPELELDEVGLPEEMAWTLFKERGIREMIQRGRTPLQAEDLWEAKDPFAKQILMQIADTVPVILNRAPTLHKHGVLAFWGRLRPGKAIGLHPLVCKGFNADFDGDNMTVYVPVLPGAIEDAKKMLPSANLWNARDGQLMYMPDQEAVQGLFLLTRSPGPDRDSVESVLPEDMRRKDRVWDKKTMTEVLEDLSRKYPQDFPGIVDKLKNLGNEAAYFHGSTLGESDLEVDTGPVKAELARVQEEALTIIDNPKLSEEAKDDALVQLYQKTDAKIMSLTRAMAGKDSQVALTLASGANAKIDQVKQVIAAATLYESGKGGSVPVLVPTNFNDGMTPADYWVSLYGARKGMIDKGISTAKPGELGKYTAASLARFVITEKDCGTKEGTEITLSDKLEAESLPGRVLAEAVEGYPAGTVLSAAHVQALVKAGVSTLRVRTPIVCEAPQGVCQLCYGNRADTQALPKIGENVGITAAHSTSEPGVQLTMKAFHTAGSSSSKNTAGITSQFDYINKLLTVPKNLPKSTTLAEAEGKITSIEKAPAGGTNVTVGDQLYFVAPGLEVSLKVGDKVEKGQPLSSGAINPHDLLEILGPDATKAYISRELRRLYKDGGTPLGRAHADVIARAMLDVAEVTDPGDHPDVVRGDVVSIPILTGFKPNDHAVDTPVDRCAGRQLARDYEALKKGTYLHEGDVAKLKELGYKYVAVFALPPRFKPKLTGVSQLPVTGTKDWMAMLGAHGLKDTLSTGAAQLYKSDAKGVHPLPGLVIGDGEWSGPVPTPAFRGK